MTVAQSRSCDNAAVKRISLVLLWAGLVAAVSWIGFEVLVAADATVSQPALSPIVVATTTTPTSPDRPTPPAEPTVSTVPATITTSTTGASTTTTVPSSTTSTTTNATTSTTSATTSTTESAATPTTSTTVADAPWEQTTVNSAGGSVRVEYKPGIVQLLAAYPNSGFSVEVEKQSPEVEVEFKSDTTEIEIRVRWEDGELDIEINES